MISTISLIISLVALIASLPHFSKFLVYHFYKPKLEVFFPPSDKDKIEWSEIVERTEINWSELATKERGKINPLNIRIKDKRALSIEIEFIIDKPWKLKHNMEKYFAKKGLGGGYPLQGGFWYRTISFHLAGYSSMSLAFPFEPQPEECSLEIIIYPKVHLSEFGFPRYFGDVDLKPIKKVFKIKT